MYLTILKTSAEDFGFDTATDWKCGFKVCRYIFHELKNTNSYNILLKITPNKYHSNI